MEEFVKNDSNALYLLINRGLEEYTKDLQDNVANAVLIEFKELAKKYPTDFDIFCKEFKKRLVELKSPAYRQHGW